MMSRVWVVMQDDRGWGETVVGVFTDPNKASEVCKTATDYSVEIEGFILDEEEA